MRSSRSKAVRASARDLGAALPKRDLYASKRESGRVLIIGGSDRFHGAPVLASRAAYSTLAALRVGAGYAVTCVPKSIAGPVRGLSPNIIVRPLSGRALSAKDLNVLEGEAAKADAVVIGMGLGRNVESLRTVAKLIDHCMRLKKRVVVDADALYALKLLRRKLCKDVLLTPNDREFAGLWKRAAGSGAGPRIKAAVGLAQKLNANVLLKGHETFVTDGRRVKMVVSRSPALATMGTGDVLSGIIGGLMAKNGDAFLSGVAGAYLHARIGDALYARKGNHILASDVVDSIPSVLKRFG